DAAAKAAVAKFQEAIDNAPETVRQAVRNRYGEVSGVELFSLLFEEEQAGRLQGLVEGPNAQRGLAAWWERVKRLFSRVWQEVRRTLGRPLKLGDVAAMDWPDAIRELNKALRAGQRIVGENGRALGVAERGAAAAGEVEARNAARRLDLLPEERASTPPWETEDVDEERQIVRFQIGGAKNEETAGSRASHAEGSSSTRPEVSGGATSHTLTRESAEPVEKFARDIAKDDVKSPEEFLTGLFAALGQQETNPDKTKYFDIAQPDGRVLSLRAANHRANAYKYKESGNTADEKMSIVVKMNEKKFVASNDVELTEFVYFPDKLTADREAAIARGIASWIRSGKYAGPKADQVNVSPKSGPMVREPSAQMLLDLGEDVLDGYAERKGIAPERRKELKEGLKKAQRFAQTARKAWERAFRIGANAEDWGKAFATKEANRGEYPTVSRVLRELYERKDSFGVEIRGLRLESAEDVAGMMMALRSPFQEMFKVVFVDGQNRVLDARVVHIGAVASTVVHPTNVLGDVPKGAKGFYISHNHPSGDPKPSNEDMALTERFRAAGRLLGLKMHDHVVTDGERYFSFKQFVTFTLPAEKQSHEAWEIGSSWQTRDVRTTASAAQVAAMARQGAKVPVVLALGQKADIRAVRLLPEGFFDGTANLDSPEVARAIFGHAMETTARAVILVVPEGTVRGRTYRFLTPIIKAGRTLDINVVDVIEDNAALDTGFRSYHSSQPEYFERAAEGGAREAGEGEKPLADGERRLPSRPWPADFPNVVVHTTRQAVERRHATDFARAKAGDVEAAARIVRSVVKPGRVKEIAARHPGAIVVPVHAVEAAGNNKLPAVYAELFEEAGLSVCGDIVQTVHAHHTGADAFDRLLRRAEFDGPVETGREYILVDDHVTQGGTLNELRHYIEERGGKVVEITTLTASKGSTIMPIKQATIDALRAKFGPELEHGLAQASIAATPEALTESEGRYLLKLSPDTFRNRIASAGLAGNALQGAWSPQGLLPVDAGEGEPIRQATIDALRAKFGSDLENGLQAAKIAGRIEALTESEGRYLLKLSPGSLRNLLADGEGRAGGDSVREASVPSDPGRNRIASAGLPGSRGKTGLQRPVQVREADGGDTGAEGLGGLENLDNLDNLGEGGQAPSTRRLIPLFCDLRLPRRAETRMDTGENK
ncbi:MAG: hypothetical protein J6Y19_11805, partial [Kiritimatiellae bacterium]|nr:hypothetical protein [Kiritimatiellia bacterium]